MADIVPRIDPGTIQAVIEANINAYYWSFATLPGAIEQRDPTCAWVDAGVGDATFNAVVHARFDPDRADAGIDAVVAHFCARSRPFTWHIGPASAPEDLGARLLAHGLTHSEDEPGMAVELDRIHAGFDPPPGLVVEAVRDEPGLRQWVDLWLFPVPDQIRQLYFEALRLRGLGDDRPWRYYLGRLDGVPVATSELFLAHGVAGVHYVVTLPTVRRRGIGAAMTSQVLREAQVLGYKIAALTASPDGIGIYRRLGFQEYCWFHRYTWEPEEMRGADDSA